MFEYISRQEKKKHWKENNRLEGLTYDEEKDEFACPSGIKLKFENEKPDVTKTGYVRNVRVYRSEKGHCNACPFHKAGTQTLSFSWKYERLKRQAKSNLDSVKGVELRKRRGNELESVFWDEKLNNKKQRYHLRGLKKVMGSMIRAVTVKMQNREVGFKVLACSAYRQALYLLLKWGVFY